MFTIFPNHDYFGPVNSVSRFVQSLSPLVSLIAIGAFIYNTAINLFIVNFNILLSNNLIMYYTSIQLTALTLWTHGKFMIYSCFKTLHN